ncbi:MAG: phosphoenolpyruvate--protein phosphotransferase [Deltaproteobacteria bacterium]|nr:phosphoenolpyruvate--protein phosphotransferase [Myxococcales bacterium]MDP3217398.1 phosphoenolpyruvate--protein phosphotransferase [Deltaproteobacteria bacterium]
MSEVDDAAPRRLLGIPASPGVVVGRAFVADRRRVTVPRRHIAPDDVESEVQRLRVALGSARVQLEQIRARLSLDASDHSVILDAHLLMLDDALLIEQSERAIRDEGLNAEWALRRTVEKIKEVFDRADDDYFRERRSDVDFVGERVLRQLMGAPLEISRPLDLHGPVVLVAHELSPADTAALARSDVMAFVTEVGSGTSHTAIMARALTIPAVVGAPDALRHIATGDMLVVDGLRGVVLRNPTDAEAADATDRGERYGAFVRSLRSNRAGAARTRDGTPIRLRANIELPGEVAVAIDHGADGIGLYRTEFLYIDRRDPPTEEEQFETFKRIVSTMAPRSVTLRTFDLGGDKFSTAFRIPKEMNPALGMRAVRLALREREVFRAQLRAMLRASAFGEVRVMIPMIAAVSELRASRGEFDRAKEELRAAGLPFRDVPFGIMVETPSAVTMSDLLAREADFFSIGTNDLMQYTLAIDRGNEHVAHLARPFDPAILRAIATVSRAAKERGIPCALCGAMAAELMAVPVLVGLGVLELSVEPTAVPEIKEALRRIDLAEAKVFAEELLGIASAEEVELRVRDRYEPVFATLLSNGENGTFTETGTFVLPEYVGGPKGG